MDIEALDTMAKQEAVQAIREFEEIGSPCVTDGEQRKFSGFAGYVLHGAKNVAPDGYTVRFVDGHSRTLPRLTSGPFSYARTADTYLEFAQEHTDLPVKQAVISPSLLTLIYPAAGLPGYGRDEFIADLLKAHTDEIRRCLDKGAHCVQIDFTESRLSLKLDDSGSLLDSFIDLINRGLEGFSGEERSRIGVHTCHGSDHGSTYSAEVDYRFLLPSLFRLNVGRVYVAVAGEHKRRNVFRIIKSELRSAQKVFVGVTNPLDDRIETPEEVRDILMEAADSIPLDQLGSTDDCGFSPFADDESGLRSVALGKMRARIEGTKLAEEVLQKA